MLRYPGSDPKGRKTNSRGTADADCVSPDGIDVEEWKSISGIDWFLALAEGMPHRVLVSPREVYEISMWISSEETQGMVGRLVVTSGKRSHMRR